MDEEENINECGSEMKKKVKCRGGKWNGQSVRRKNNIKSGR